MTIYNAIKKKYAKAKVDYMRKRGLVARFYKKKKGYGISVKRK